MGALDANAEEGGGLGDSVAGADDELQGWEKKVARFGEALSSAFPLWVGLATILALVVPKSMSWMNGPVQVWALTLTMLGMYWFFHPRKGFALFMASIP